MERCDGYRRGVRRYRKVRQLTGSVTKEVCQLICGEV